MPSAPLKILVLLNRVPWPLNDGGAIGAYNFVKGYAESGCKVTILTMNTSKHFVEQQKVMEVLGGFGLVQMVAIDNRIKPVDALLNLFNGTSYIIQRFVSTVFKTELIHILSKEDFDVVHVDGLPPAAYIETIRQHSRAKISMRAHNVEHVIWERIAVKESNPLKKWYTSIQAKRLKDFEIKAIQQCDVVMAISKEDQDTIKKCCPQANTLIVPAGMDIDEVAPNHNFDPADLFFIGSFDWMPNQQGVNWFLSEVWQSLAAKWTQLRLTVAGKKMPAGILALRSAQLNPVGEVPEARNFMLEHGVMIVPVISGSGIRIKILEGMALGKTIIATTIAAEGLDLNDGENILIADTSADFVNKIAACMNDSVFCASIGMKAHAFALAHYRNKNIFERLLAEYRNLK